MSTRILWVNKNLYFYLQFLGFGVLVKSCPSCLIGCASFSFEHMKLHSLTEWEWRRITLGKALNDTDYLPPVVPISQSGHAPKWAYIKVRLRFCIFIWTLTKTWSFDLFHEHVPKLNSTQLCAWSLRKCVCVMKVNRLLQQLQQKEREQADVISRYHITWRVKQSVNTWVCLCNCNQVYSVFAECGTDLSVFFSPLSSAFIDFTPRQK